MPATSPRAHRLAAGAAALAALSLAAPARAQNGDPTADRQARVRRLGECTWTARAAPADSSLVIDGKMGEPAWLAAEPIADFYQRERNEGLPATERTEVRVLYDRRNLYIGFHAFDSHPELASAKAIFRDESGGADDLVSIMLDAFHDHRSAIQLASNCNGVAEDFDLDAGRPDAVGVHRGRVSRRARARLTRSPRSASCVRVRPEADARWAGRIRDSDDAAGPVGRSGRQAPR